MLLVGPDLFQLSEKRQCHRQAAREVGLVPGSCDRGDSLSECLRPVKESIGPKMQKGKCEIKIHKC